MNETVKDLAIAVVKAALVASVTYGIQSAVDKVVIKQKAKAGLAQLNEDIERDLKVNELFKRRKMEQERSSTKEEQEKLEV